MSGQLYEVDTRLRPSGSAGLLVSSMDSFEKYQLNQAWTWEHQALVRARVVAGCNRARARFDAIRHQVLCAERPLDKLREDVLAMRDKMVDHLGEKGEERFHLKQDPGGIVDIEFMVQYGVLRWASSHGELTRFTDNVRLLETLAALDIMSAQDAGLLREAYLAYRSAAHRASLRKEKSIVDDTQFRDLREGVRAIWKHWFDLQG
jgi:glutamate-ammonia-ligase adenylyltransferase